MSNERIEKLVSEINYHNNKYWVEDESEITDEAYDLLKVELKQLDPNNELLNVVDDSFIWGTKVTHSKPMLSLDKIFNSSELELWINKVKRTDSELFDIQLKYDGMAARLSADKNQLVTRGDGSEGIDISDKLELLSFIGIDETLDDTVYGEILCLNDNFEYYKEHNKLGKTYKNSRNMIGGVMRKKDLSEIDPSIKLTFVNHEHLTKTVTASELVASFETITNSIIEVNKNFPQDGIVIKLNDREYSETLGNTSHHPRGAVAFKFADKEHPTVLKDVVWQSGKRKLTPVAIVEPVEIDGVTVKRVTLHNAKNIMDMDLKLNDTVYIKRSGSVIPYITKRIEGDFRQTISINTCPVCNSAVIYKEPDLMCGNSSCIGNLKKQLAESIKTLGIEECGFPTIEKMVDELNITKVSEILTLDWEDIRSLSGFADKSATTLYSNLHNISEIKDYQVLASLNIKGIGKTLSKQLLNKYDIYELIELSVDTLASLENMGPERSVELTNGIYTNYDELSDLLEIIQPISTYGTAENAKTICFSGKFSKKKSILEQKAIQLGYNVKSSVSNDLDILVTAGAITTKVAKAKKIGITVITESDFLKL